MADIVNLRLIRKQKLRSSKEQRAAENRARHGTGKALYDKLEKETIQAERRLDGHRLDRGPRS